MPNYVKHIFKVGLLKFPNSIKFQLRYAYYLFEELDSAPLALEQLSNIEKAGGMWLTDSYQVERLRMEIQRKNEEREKDMESKNSLSNSTILGVLSEKEWEKSMLSTFESLSYVFIEFWNNISTGSPDYQITLNLGKKIKYFDQELTSLIS